MDCTRLSHLLSAYIDGELDAEEKRQIRQHLINCRQCNDDLEQSKEIHHILGRLESVKPSYDFSALVREELRNSATIDFIPGNPKTVSRILMFAAAAALIGIFSLNGFVRNATPGSYAQEKQPRKVQVVSDSPAPVTPFSSSNRRHYFPANSVNGSSTSWSVRSVVAGQDNRTSIFNNTPYGFYEINLFSTGQY